MNEYTGMIEHFFCQKEDFIIARWRSEKGERFTIVGSLYGADRNELLTIRGQWKMHPKYGQQLEIDYWERPLPKTRDQIISFLCSKFVKGCGPKRAAAIVKHLGEDALGRIMTEGSHCLTAISGINANLAEQIADSIKSNFAIQQVMMKLLPYGITPNMVAKLYKQYGDEAAEIIRNNPYRLTELDQISYLKADEIAEKVGFNLQSPFRIDACIHYLLNERCYTGGHCFVPAKELITKVSELLKQRAPVSSDAVLDSIIQLSMHKQIEWEGERVYPVSLYHYESKLAQKLAYMVGRSGEAMPMVETMIRQYQTEHRMVLAEKQREAIRELFRRRFLIVTGNPGTGKTTVVKAMLELYKKKYPDHRIGLAGMLGRVARNLKKLTGLEAETAHMMLGFKPGGEPQYNEALPLPYDLIFVDEWSMADVQTAYFFFQAVGLHTKVVLIGDSDQLPSVGPGNVLRDMMDAGLPHIRLTEIFRQAQNSQIVMNAHRINQGQPIVVDPLKDDFYFIEQSDPNRIAHLIERSFLRFIEKGYNVQDILVLAPMKKGVIGTEELNTRLQAAVNPPSTQKAEWVLGERVYRQGDKIIKSKRNDYIKGVLNGDIGVVKGVGFARDDEGNVTEEKVLICEIEGKVVQFKQDELSTIRLAYACTIHKTIGGQAPVVIMPVSTSHHRMLQRNLIYTGMTRAERVFVAIGTQKALSIAIQNNQAVNRNTGLSQRIKGRMEGGVQWRAVASDHP